MSIWMISFYILHVNINKTILMAHYNEYWLSSKQENKTWKQLQHSHIEDFVEFAHRSSTTNNNFD